MHNKLLLLTPFAEAFRQNSQLVERYSFFVTVVKVDVNKRLCTPTLPLRPHVLLRYLPRVKTALRTPERAHTLPDTYGIQ